MDHDAAVNGTPIAMPRRFVKGLACGQICRMLPVDDEGAEVLAFDLAVVEPVVRVRPELPQRDVELPFPGLLIGCAGRTEHGRGLTYEHSTLGPGLRRNRQGRSGDDGASQQPGTESMADRAATGHRGSSREVEAARALHEHHLVLCCTTDRGYAGKRTAARAEGSSTCPRPRSGFGVRLLVGIDELC